jgi:hypothetical protein
MDPRVNADPRVDDTRWLHAVNTDPRVDAIRLIYVSSLKIPAPRVAAAL